MKKIIVFLIAISFLFQSCYSYKSINPTTAYLKNGRIYKIKQQTGFEKVKLKSFTDSTMTVINGKIEKEFLKKDIIRMKERNFSTPKTVLFVVSTTVLGFISLFALTYSPNVGTFQSPN